MSTLEAAMRRSGSLSAHARDYSILLVVIAVAVVLSFLSDAFLTSANLENILTQNAPIGIVACGMTLVIIAGGFDLSVGATFALAGVVASWLAVHVGAVPGLAGGMALGVLVGCINGLLVTQLRVNSFLATLASSLTFRGIAVAITGGFLITVAGGTFRALGEHAVGGINYSVFFFLAVAVVLQLLLWKTTFGRYVYAVGGNPEAARLSGIRVDGIRILTFVVSGVCASVAGVLAASRIGTGQAETGLGLELDAIAAVVLGGTSILGGIGAVWRTVLGVLLLALITNGFNILEVQPYFQEVAKGLIIIAAVAANSFAVRD